MVELGVLLERVLAGESAAWHELWRRAEPVVFAVSGRWQVAGPLAKSHDDRREIVLRVMERLREGDFRRLRSFAASAGARSDPAFRAWLATVATRVAIDHVRAHPEHVDARGRRGDDRWAKLVPLEAAPELRDEGDLQGRATALRLLEHARQELDVEQLRALHLWLDGVDHEAIAKRLELADAQSAHKLVRAALKRLRDHYRDAAPRTESDAEGRT